MERRCRPILGAHLGRRRNADVAEAFLRRVVEKYRGRPAVYRDKPADILKRVGPLFWGIGFVQRMERVS